MRKWIAFDISDGTSNKDASCVLLLRSYGALLCVQCVWGMEGTPVCGNVNFLRYLAVYLKYWRSILAVYFGVYGRILGRIRPYTRSVRGISASHPCHHSHQLHAPPCKYS